MTFNIICGIAITRYKNLVKTLDHQEYRGLDSLGVVNLKHGTINKCVRTNLKDYKTAILELDHKDGLCAMHHRKASVGKISVNNSHPFQKGRFCLMQNGTSRDFMKLHGEKYGRETDSETLVHYLEEKCKDLSEVLKELDELKDTFGVLIIIDTKARLVLAYSDGTRESYVKIQNGILKGFFSFDPNRYFGYVNEGYVICDYEGKIVEKKFEGVLNLQKLAPKVTHAYVSPYVYKGKGVDNFNRWEEWDGQNTIQPALIPRETIKRNTGKINKSEFIEISNSGLSEGALSLLINNNILTYEELFECSEYELCVMKGTKLGLIDEIKELLLSWGVSLSHDKNDIYVKEYRDALEDLEFSEFDRMIESNFKIEKEEEEIASIVKIGKRNGEFFYSEKILKDDGLLFSDIQCYILRSERPTLKGYAYQCMGIPKDIAIKRVVGKQAFKRMKKLFSVAINKIDNTD